MCNTAHTYLLDDASDARDSADAGALELGHLELAVEHATQEGGVLVHLERRPLQLQLLHHTHRRIQIQDDTGRADPPGLQQSISRSHIPIIELSHTAIPHKLASSLHRYAPQGGKHIWHTCWFEVLVWMAMTPVLGGARAP